MAELPRDSPVRYAHGPVAGTSGEGIMRAGDLADLIHETIARQADGWLTIEEAAQVLEDAGRGTATGPGGWKGKLTSAARSGDLPMHKPGTYARHVHAPDRPVRVFHELAHRDDLDLWLAEHEPRLPYRFNVRTPEVRTPGQVLRLASGTTHIRFDELAHLIADALWPEQGPDDARLRYGAARLNLDDELKRAVEDGPLRVLDPLTLGPRPCPIGAGLQRALVSVGDLGDWLQATRSMRVATAEDGATEVPKPVPRHRAQEFAIMAKLRELGYDPQALPPTPRGKASPAKRAVASALTFSPAVMSKAWQRLRNDGSIRDA